MQKNRSILKMSSALILAVLVVVLPSLSWADTGNLIQNPNLDNATNPNLPDHWSMGGNFGTSNKTFTYPVAGPNGASDKAIEVGVSGYVNGDAKWIFENVPVVAGHEYLFSDSYKSNVPSNLTAEFFDASQNHVSYGGFFYVAPSNDWSAVNATFVIPQGVSYMTVYHLIAENGTLTTDNYSLTEAATPQPFSQGFVTLTFDDGWVSQYNSAFPEMKALGMKGTFFIITTPMKNSSKNLFTDAQSTADMQTLTDGSGSEWSPIYLDPSNQNYFFTDTYSSTAPSSIDVSYTDSMGFHVITSSDLPVGDNMHGSFSFSIPVGITPGISIKHKSDSGSLEVHTKTLEIVSSDYMGTEQVRDLQREGNEIAVHTRDHCNLVYVSDPVRCAYAPTLNPATLSHEINGAQDDLVAVGLSPADTIAYPYGSYDSTVKSFVSSSNKFLAGRGLDLGYNFKNSDKFALKVQVVDAGTTLPMVQSWVSSAKASNSWLILVFHQVDNPVKLQSNGETGGTTPELFNQIVEYIHNENVPVKTMREGVLAMTEVPADTTAPVTSLIGSDPMSLDVGGTFTDPGANVTDNVDAPRVIQGTGSVDTANAGSYTLHYNASDNAGNPASEVTRTVNVNAPAPVVTPPPTSGGGGGSSNSSPSSSSGTRRRPTVRGGQVLGASTFRFIRGLRVGVSGDDVTELQKKLTLEGVYSGPITGYFGKLTEAAVKLYQQKYLIDSIGIVGPKTLAQLNSADVLAEGETDKPINPTVVMTPEQIKSMLMQIQAQLDSLLANR